MLYDFSALQHPFLSPLLTNQMASKDEDTISANEGVLNPASGDAEKQIVNKDREDVHVSVFKSLGFIDRFLAVWILLAIIIGILLGNFVPSTGAALQKGKFVGVSIPIGGLPHQISSECN